MIKYDAKRNNYVFSSGRTIYANAGIVGISPDLNLSEGYDGSISWPPLEYESDPLTKEDVLELVDMMIDRWRKFRGNVE